MGVSRPYLHQLDAAKVRRIIHIIVMETKDLTFLFSSWLIIKQVNFRPIEVMLSRNRANRIQNHLGGGFFGSRSAGGDYEDRVPRGVG